MNSAAHDACAQWIISEFTRHGLTVTPQQALLKGYDGTMLRATNIIASYRPDLKDRILICAHWDSRPWADNDPDEANWHKPVLAANDGASGVAMESVNFEPVFLSNTAEGNATLSGDSSAISNIVDNGYHRTATEMAKKDNESETMAGANVRDDSN